jgi:branched-chain amino acid transport system ATP-binding protein
LSPLVCKELFQALSRIKEMDVGVLLVEQNARAALAIADRGYLLENGRVVGEGPAAQLQDDPAVRQAYLGGGAQGANGHAAGADGAYRNGHAARSAAAGNGSAPPAPTVPSPLRGGWRHVEDMPPAWAPGGGTARTA